MKQMRGGSALFKRIHSRHYPVLAVLFFLCTSFPSCVESEMDCKSECDSNYEACRAISITRADDLDKLECWLACSELFDNCYDNCGEMKKLEEGPSW